MSQPWDTDLPCKVVPDPRDTEIVALRAERDELRRQLAVSREDRDGDFRLFRADMAGLRAEVERLTESNRSLQAQVELGEAYESRLLAEVGRLRAALEQLRPDCIDPECPWCKQKHAQIDAAIGASPSPGAGPSGGTSHD